MHAHARRTLYRIGASIALTGLASTALAAPGRAASSATQFARFGGPAVGFTVQAPAGWSTRQTGPTEWGAELVFTGPKDSGLSALVSNQRAEAGQSLETLLPNHSQILHQRPVTLSWATGTESVLLHDRGTAATGDRGQSLELHAVLAGEGRLYHVALITASGYWPARQQTADGIYRTLLTTLAPVRATPAIQFGPAAAMVGHKIAVQGTGWPASARISFSLGGVNTGAGGNYGAALADKHGAFSTMVTLGRYPDGTPIETPSTVVLVAHTADWSLKATAPIVVAKPRVSVDRAAGPAGSTVTLRGEGWPNGARVWVSLGGGNTGAGGNYGSGVADVSGRFAIKVKLAAQPDGAPLKPGTITLVTHNADSSLKATAPFSVTGR
jgi:hypothetical protein